MKGNASIMMKALFLALMLFSDDVVCKHHHLKHQRRSSSSSDPLTPSGHKLSRKQFEKSLMREARKMKGVFADIVSNNVYSDENGLPAFRVDEEHRLIHDHLDEFYQEYVGMSAGGMQEHLNKKLQLEEEDSDVKIDELVGLEYTEDESESDGGASVDDLVSSIPSREGEIPHHVRGFYRTLAASATEYYDDMHGTATLDSKFPMFKGTTRAKWVQTLVGILSLDAGEALMHHFVNFKKELHDGELNTANKAMERCNEIATQFLILHHASDVVKGIVDIVTFGITHHAKNISSSVTGVVDTAEEAASVVAAHAIPTTISVMEKVGHTISNVELHTRRAEVERITDSVSTKTKVFNVTETVISAAGGTAYGIVTLGIGPLVGWVTKKIVESVRLRWRKDIQYSACLLSAFGAVTNRLRIQSAWAAESIGFKVKDEEDVIEGAGKITELTTRAFKESNNDRVRYAHKGIVATKDILAILKEDLNVVDGFRDMAQIVESPLKGVSTMIRRYGFGNEFQKAVKFSGTNLVGFLMSSYWEEYTIGLERGMDMNKAGLIKNLVGIDSSYKTLFSDHRYGRGLDYGPGGSYENSYRCLHGLCATDCLSSIGMSDLFCYARDPHIAANTRMACATKADCYNRMSPVYPSFSEIQCASNCGTRLAVPIGGADPRPLEMLRAERDMMAREVILLTAQLLPMDILGPVIKFGLPLLTKLMR